MNRGVGYQGVERVQVMDVFLYRLEGLMPRCDVAMSPAV